MSASSVATPPVVAAGDCVVLPNVSWETYERLLADDQERRVPRMTFDQGVLELVTPSKPHDLDAAAITRIVDIVSAKLGIPVQSTATTTYRRPDLERAFEADASFYIQNEARVRDSREADLQRDPPPDLVLEMEVSRSALDKLALFAGMGIPEVWRCDGQRITIHVLAHGSYHESPSSLALPALTSDVLTRFLRLSRTMLSPEWFQMVGDWARAQRDASG